LTEITRDIFRVCSWCLAV